MLPPNSRTYYRHTPPNNTHKTIKTLSDASRTGLRSDRFCALFTIPSAILLLYFQHELDAKFQASMEGCSGFFRIHSDGEGVDLIRFLNGQEFQRLWVLCVCRFAFRRFDARILAIVPVERVQDWRITVTAKLGRVWFDIRFRFSIRFFIAAPPKCFGDGNSESLFFQVCNMPNFCNASAKTGKPLFALCASFFWGRVNARPPL